MSDLAEFLLTCFAEDEDVIRSTGAPLYRTEARGVVTMRVPAGYSLEPAAQRALAECAAKRQIVELYLEVVRDEVMLWDQGMGAGPALDAVLQMLAQPYADHDGFREEWRA